LIECVARSESSNFRSETCGAIFRERGSSNLPSLRHDG
jgi:hypothetical protein